MCREPNSLINGRFINSTLLGAYGSFIGSIPFIELAGSIGSPVVMAAAPVAVLSGAGIALVANKIKRDNKARSARVISQASKYLVSLGSDKAIEPDVDLAKAYKKALKVYARKTGKKASFTIESFSKYLVQSYQTGKLCNNNDLLLDRKNIIKSFVSSVNDSDRGQTNKEQKTVASSSKRSALARRL